MRIAQEAHVEDQVGVARQPMTIRKRRHGNGDAGLRRQGEMTLQQTLEIARRETARIDYQIGAVTQRPDALAFEPNAVGHRTFERQGMAPTRLSEAPLKMIVVAIEE